MKDNRKKTFQYIFSEADKIGYMGLDSSASGRFQDQLQSDSTLKSIAGEQLSRNYIKDTVLNNYSKERRYILADDITKVLSGISSSDIIGSKKDLENGVFYVEYNGIKIRSTSVSFGEWQTALKRFGRKVDGGYSFAFLTCGGVSKTDVAISEVKDILASYGITAFVVKPHETPRVISDIVKIGSSSGAVVGGIQLPKPFLLLAGISGTGKTRFVREQAAEHRVGKKNFCLVPVRPDWHEPSDLLGYVSRIGEKPEYVSTKVLQFVIEAWRSIAPNANKDGMGQLNLLSPPYWLCLDEMNLAPVEQYFADYLSVLESRKFTGDKYSCDPLLDESVLLTKGADVKSDLGLDNDKDLWEFFRESGISIPPNLIVAGTVNMDETTHGFSRKVIDRALTIDFGEFFPNDYNKIFGEQDVPKILTFGMLAQVTRETINCPADKDGEKTIAFLGAINDVLRDTPFELAYRALNELLLHVNCFVPENEAELQAVWDDFLMTKVLPRIDGDEDKLRITVDQGSENLLDTLQMVVGKLLSEIWGDDKVRSDLFRKQHDGSDIDNVACRSKKKIKWMKARLDTNTFTSYWP